jgi:hypothetical protein
MDDNASRPGLRHNGGSARVLLELSITQPDLVERRSLMPAVGSIWRNGLWGAGLPVRQA